MAKDMRISLMEKESEARQEVMHLMHKHEQKRYVYDGMTAELKPGQEKVSIQKTKERAMMIIGVDPGPRESAFVEWDGEKVLRHGDLPNCDLRLGIQRNCADDLALGSTRIAIEQIRGFGLTASNDLFDTCFWSGRFVEAWGEENCVMIPRKKAVAYLCGIANPKNADKHVREALIDRLGAPGTKKSPGPTYGIAGHRWAALAVAVTAWDRIKEK